MNFASFAHADELMHIHNERNFPKARLDSEINVPFLLNGHGDLYFYHIITEYISSFI